MHQLLPGLTAFSDASDVYGDEDRSHEEVGCKDRSVLPLTALTNSSRTVR